MHTSNITSRGSIFLDRQFSNILLFNFCRCTQSCHYMPVQTCLFRGSNFQGLAVNHENSKNWTPQKFPTIQYVLNKCMYMFMYINFKTGSKSMCDWIWESPSGKPGHECFVWDPCTICAMHVLVSTSGQKLLKIRFCHIHFKEPFF